MTKSNDSLQQYVSLRGALQRERETLQQRLKQIEDALGIVEAPRRGRPPGSSKSAAAVSAPAAPSKPAGKRGRPIGSSNKMGMRETIAKLLGKGSMPIGDIVAGMKRSGYVFKSSNPTNSVG